MDVDARSRPVPVASTPHTLPRSSDAVRPPTLEASPEPVEEDQTSALPASVTPATFKTVVSWSAI
ncbi:uncharacterized protein BXZ73DRAFT_100157 [Epithele typhae]|uniref:uncharacterized protein n=1 Tax=Epithele typhae TaxID=378194 RepID=UPI002007D776|nr:uncharacterized protein BXZ73DRAFT_100157 [Epithele typhae]KAH9936735.1 hypothetical protein BXZ73DRAFT_100157 [Epithele typhae]